VRRLVYLDAFVPAGGDCVLDYFPPPIAEQIRASGPFVAPLPPHMLGLVQEDDIAWVTARLTKQPLATLTQRVTVAETKVPRSYVECTLGASEKPFGMFAARARARGCHVTTLEAGHDAMVTAPESLAKLLESIASL
jgi:hypothetical protein